MLHTLSAIVASFPDRERLALVGSNFRDSNERASERAPGTAARQPPDEPSDDRWEDVDCVITSGTLLPLAAHSAIGPFREEFFIDYVDEEYCLRARAKGYRVIRSRKQIMQHTIGAPTVHKTLWIRKWTSNHTPDRRYIALYERTKTRKIAAVMQGWWDGVRGNMGPRNPRQGASAGSAAASTSFVSGRHGS
jgi:rhamnosyltransferase